MLKTRLAKYDDVSSISTILAASWKTAYRGIVADDYLAALRNDQWVDFLTVGLNKGTLFAMVLEDDQHMIGTAIIGREEANTAKLISFYLLPDRIGQGCGHIFYDEMEQELRSRGYSKCLLDVLAGNGRAIRFYETHGFVVTGSTSTAILGDNKYLCKLYEKILD